jgi:alkyl sulfatase BDS1-like metallo-beta-lactamase superfamily hydrolase
MQRDAYGFTHNQTLRLANNGYVLQDLGDAIYEVMPESIQKAWHTNGYHGTYSHNARAVYNMYLGYFDMNPANLNPLPTKLEAKKYVEYMGGSGKIIKHARADFDKGEYRFVATAMNKLVMAEPDNVEARALLADTFEQLGYQSEGAGWRNIYLSGAQELRVGGITPGTPKTASADVLSEMDIGMLLDFFAVRVDSIKAQHTPFTLNVMLPDIDEVYFVEMSNGNLSNAQVEKPMKADATLTINKSDVTQLLLKRTKLEDLFEAKAASVTGDAAVVETLGDSMVDFNPAFEIVPFSDNPVDANLYKR